MTKLQFAELGKIDYNAPSRNLPFIAAGDALSKIYFW
jgi:hypothetical protein